MIQKLTFEMFVLILDLLIQAALVYYVGRDLPPV